MPAISIIIKGISHYQERKISKKILNKLASFIIRFINYDWLIKNYVTNLHSVNDPKRLIKYQHNFLSLGIEGAKRLIPLIPEVPATIQIWCIEILGNYTNELDYTIFQDILRAEEFTIRIYALKYLLKYPAEQVIDIIIKHLNDPHWGVRSQAVKALGILNCKKAIPSLEEMLEDNSGIVREYTRQVLQELRK